ncbi:hypothetical protein MRB53_041718 [Persea americana]|nr:hypothetical protein MRB53_041718 [Persea americana]
MLSIVPTCEVCHAVYAGVRGVVATIEVRVEFLLSQDIATGLFNGPVVPSHARPARSRCYVQSLAALAQCAAASRSSSRTIHFRDCVRYETPARRCCCERDLSGFDARGVYRGACQRLRSSVCFMPFPHSALVESPCPIAYSRSVVFSMWSHVRSGYPDKPPSCSSGPCGDLRRKLAQDALEMCRAFSATPSSATGSFRVIDRDRHTMGTALRRGVYKTPVPRSRPSWAHRETAQMWYERASRPLVRVQLYRDISSEAFERCSRLT